MSLCNLCFDCCPLVVHITGNDALRNGTSDIAAKLDMMSHTTGLMKYCTVPLDDVGCEKSPATVQY